MAMFKLVAQVIVEIEIEHQAGDMASALNYFESLDPSDLIEMGAVDSNIENPDVQEISCQA